MNFDDIPIGVGVLALAIVALISGCGRYELVNELDVPGLCPSEEERRIARERVPPIAYERVTATAADSLRGRIVESDRTGNEITDRPVRSAQVYFLGTGQGMLSDSIGRFILGIPAEGPHVLRVVGLGYSARVDTLHTTLSADSGVVIALRPGVLDGPCSGFAAVRVPKPWWKWW